MDDKELLELAAKAAGYIVEPDAHIPSGGIWLSEQDGDKPWSPLADNGDAMRLAVKLHISVSWSPSGRFVKASVCDNPFLVFGMDSTDDACSDARRAIVSAAAEIGGSM